jgi:putative acetyltransferase
MKIQLDDLQGSQIQALLQEHVSAMRAASPPESCHVLDLTELQRPEITFWSVWDGDTVAGCGALKQLDARHAEIKSMRTAATHMRRGVAAYLMEHMIAQAQVRGYTRLSLETGAQANFIAARKLYERFGFEVCAPFGEYVEDPLSVFMTKVL